MDTISVFYHDKSGEVTTMKFLYPEEIKGNNNKLTAIQLAVVESIDKDLKNLLEQKPDITQDKVQHPAQKIYYKKRWEHTKSTCFPL